MKESGQDPEPAELDVSRRRGAHSLRLALLITVTFMVVEFVVKSRFDSLNCTSSPKRIPLEIHTKMHVDSFLFDNRTSLLRVSLVSPF